jgi:hypothetical protein
VARTPIALFERLHAVTRRRQLAENFVAVEQAHSAASSSRDRPTLVEQWGLLHAVADAMIVVLRLDQRDRDIRLVIENKVGLLGLAARDQLAAHDDPALSKIDLLPNLQHLVPAGTLNGRQDELGGDVAFA